MCTEYSTAVSNLRKVVHNKMHVIRMDSVTTFASPVTKYDDLKVSQEWSEVYDGVHIIECSISTDELTVVNVRFEEGGELPLHKHIDREETIYVVSGEIKDKISGTITREGDVYVIPEDTPHLIMSDHALLVITYKPAYETLDY